MLFDRKALRARPGLGSADFLHQRLVDELVERLAVVNRRFDRALVTGPLTQALREKLAATGIPTVFSSAMADARPDVVADLHLPFRRAFPLALSINELALADDPVTALGELRGTLRPDGLFLGAAASAGTLSELADALLTAEAELSDGAAMRVAPFADVRRWGDALARAGFALPVVDEIRITVRYPTLHALLADLDGMGVRRVLATRRPAPRRLFAAAETHYRARAADPDGRLRATFAFAFLSGWAPDPSQQRPARRGSATMRLDDALRVIDQGAHEDIAAAPAGGAPED